MATFERREKENFERQKMEEFPFSIDITEKEKPSSKMPSKLKKIDWKTRKKRGILPGKIFIPRKRF